MGEAGHHAIDFLKYAVTQIAYRQSADFAAIKLYGWRWTARWYIIKATMFIHVSEMALTLHQWRRVCINHCVCWRHNPLHVDVIMYVSVLWRNSTS